MKPIAAIFIAMVIVTGCKSISAPPAPGMATAEIHILAEPKVGVKEPFVRVPVYDAAPIRASASGTYEHVDYSNLSDIIIWLEPNVPQQRGFRPSLKVPINPAAPSTSVYPAHVSQMLELWNSSNKQISLYSVSDGNDFEFPSIAPGAKATYTIRSEGLIEILADPSRPPVALVYAAPSQWITRARSGDIVTFADHPPGKYRIQVWHPRLPGSSIDVELSPNQVSHITLSIGVNSLPHVP